MDVHATTDVSAGLTGGGGTPIVPVTEQRRRGLSAPGWLRLILSDRKAAVGVAILTFFVLVAIFGPLIWQGDPNVGDFTVRPQQAPSAAHWLGTDQQGRDIFLGLVDGTRVALIICFSVGAIATAIAVVVGLSAGYFGGWVDEVLMLITNIVLVIPSFPLIIVVTSFIQAKNDYVPIVIILSLTGWAFGARVLRSQAMSLRQKDFIQASVVRGESSMRIVLRDILPNMISLVVSGFIGTVLYALGTSAALVFLGYGNLSQVSWFSMLYWAQNASALQVDAWWLFVPPGLAIALVGMACALINFGIDEVSNPRLRTEKVKIPRGAVRPVAVASSGKVAAR